MKAIAILVLLLAAAAPPGALAQYGAGTPAKTQPVPVGHAAQDAADAARAAQQAIERKSVV